MSACNSTPDAAEAHARAEALRSRLREALKSARRDLADAEETNQKLRRELEVMRAARGRRAAVAVRTGVLRAARAIRHPLWTLGTTLRRVGASTAPSTARRALEYLLRRTFPLRLSAPHRRWADATDTSLAIRWIGQVNVRHRRLDALLCHPPAGVEYRERVPAGSRFVCECAVAPQVWQEHPPPIEFLAALELPATGWRQEARTRIDPGARWTDRRWHALTIPLPPGEDPAVEVIVTLSTRVPSGASLANAWALFGEPRFEWRRRPSEVRRSVGTFARRLRTDGLRGSLALISGAGTALDDGEGYARWVARHTRTDAQLIELSTRVAGLPYQPLISVITPVYNTEPRWLRACVESVRRQVYTRWELCICDDASSRPETVQVLREFEDDPRIKVKFAAINAGIAAASNTALQLAGGEYLAFLDHDDELAPDALAEIVLHLNEHPEADVIYSDEDKLDPAGRRCDVFFKPDWAPDHFLSCMYTCHLMVARREIVGDLGGFRKGYEGAQDYDLLLRVMEKTTRIHHLPRVLYHWRKLPQSTASSGQAKPWALDAGRLALEDYVRRNGLDAEILPGAAPGLYRFRRAIRGRPLVSIIIPTAGRLRKLGERHIDVLADAIRSIVQKTTYERYELILVADPAGVPDTTHRVLQGTDHQVLVAERLGLFNFSAKVNAGAAAARGEHLLLFNDDLEVIAPDWLAAMLEYSQEAAVGAVGAKLLYPDGRLQHIGILLGVAGIAAHAFHQHLGSSAGYGGSALIARNYSAVTGACLMTRTAVFEQIGRFDERFPTDFNDVDYCLRLQQAGYRVVYTPWAQLYHHESASFGARRQDLAGLGEMRRRWAPQLDRDPYYNPNLSRDFPDYRVDA